MNQEIQADPHPTKTLRLHHYGHPRALFCCRACRDGFREDRRSGLIYGPYFIRSLNRFAMCIEEASAIDKFCPYCNAKEEIAESIASMEACTPTTH